MSDESAVIIEQSVEPSLTEDVPDSPTDRTADFHATRSISLNIRNNDTGAPFLSDEDSPPDMSGVKISLHLSMDQSQMQGSGSRTKKFLDSDDTIISQIFSQTISSAGVTPTDECEEFFGSDVPMPDSLEPNESSNNNKKASSIESPRTPNSEENEEEEEEEDDDTDDIVKGTSRLTILNNQQRPSIVIDCFDETPPITPEEEMTPSAGAAFYFHTTIVDEDDVTIKNGTENTEDDVAGDDNNSFDQSSSGHCTEISDELLQQAVAIADNFTTIVEDDDDIVDQIIATDDVDIEQQYKTDNNNDDNDNNSITISNEETTINQTYKELAETETNEAPIHFLCENNHTLEPEPALIHDNQVDPIGYTNGSGLDDSDEDEDDDDESSVANNMTAKTISFDDEACINIILLHFFLITLKLRRIFQIKFHDFV